MGGETENIQQLIVQCDDILRQLAPKLAENEFMLEHKRKERLHLIQLQQSLHSEQHNLLCLLEDLFKLRSMKPIEIPQKPHQPPLTYYALAEDVGGATEKLSLIDAASLRTKLQWLVDNATDVSIKNYHEVRGQFKLSTQAILKLPKHGNVLEVQREKMALDISSLLGLQTTNATLMDYKGEPALFVPFDKITLLHEVARGKTMHAHLGSLKDYLHYSTINSVGEGLQANAWMSEFGHSLGLFYLCSDTDAIGGYNQNKALKDNQLYIFDQVISPDDKFRLDSRLSMKPTKFITHHTRHDQGRNRTLIEDSSIKSKFQALTALQRKRREIGQYCDRVIDGHKKTLHDLSVALKQPISKDKKKQLRHKRELDTALLHDAEKIKTKLLQRIDEIDDVLPKSAVEPIVIQQTLLLEKMLNHPVLFTEDGRSYRNPWTDENRIKVLAIENRNDVIHIRLNAAIPEDIINMIQRQMGVQRGDSWLDSKKELNIPKNVLLALQESTLFPEHELRFDEKKNYLNVDDLNVIWQGYEDEHHHDILDLIEAYHVRSSQNATEVLDNIETTEKALNLMQEHLQHKGFIKHVLRKFQFDVQQKLQRMVPEDGIRETIQQAFNAALKLDQVSSFNHVILEALYQRKLNEPVFLDYLKTCINASQAATDHFSALKQSETIRVSAQTTVSILQNEGKVIYQASLTALGKLDKLVTKAVVDQYEHLSPEELEDFKSDHPDLSVFITLRHALMNATRAYQQQSSSQLDLSAIAKLGQQYKRDVVQCFTDALASARPSAWKIIVNLFEELKRNISRIITSFISSKSSPPALSMVAEKKMSNKEIKSALIDIKDGVSPQPRAPKR